MVSAASENGAESFEAMLYARFGRSIAEKFLIPYNEKLYACDLGSLDKDAMGRFFPHADLTDIIRNMKVANNATYNAKFTYPEGGAIEYVKALASAVRSERIAVSEPVLAIDVDRVRGPHGGRNGQSLRDAIQADDLLGAQVGKQVIP